MGKYTVSDFEEKKIGKYTAADFTSKPSGKYTVADFEKGATLKATPSKNPFITNTIPNRLGVPLPKFVNAPITPLNKMMSQAKTITPPISGFPINKLNNKIDQFKQGIVGAGLSGLGKGIDLLSRPQNALSNVLRAQTQNRLNPDFTKRIDEGQALIKGITGKERPNVFETLMTPKQAEKVHKNLNPTVNMLLDMMITTSQDPTMILSLGAGVLAKNVLNKVGLVKKMTNGVATIEDIAQATGKTEKELQGIIASERAVQIEKANQLLSTAKPVINSRPFADIGKSAPILPKPIGEIGNQIPIKNTPILANDTLKPLGQELKAQNGVKLQTLGQDTTNILKPQSKFAQTIADSKNTVPQLSKDLKNLNLGYDKVTNEQSLMQANKRIADNSENAVRFVLDTTTPSAEHTATALQLINKFQNEGNFERAVDIASDISSKLTKNGQAIQAASIYDRLSPEGILMYAQRRVNKLNDERWFKGLTKEQKINPNLAKELKGLSENMKNLTGDARVEASQELQQALQALGKSTGLRKLESTQTIGQLLTPKTNIRNIVGNELFYKLERLNKYVATPIDVARSTLTGADRTVTFKTNNSAWSRYFTGYAEGGTKQGLKSALYSPYMEGLTKGVKAGWKGVNPAGLTTQFDLTAPAFSGKWNPLTYMEKALGASLKGFDYAAYNRAVKQTIGEMAELKAMNQGLSGVAKKTVVQDFMKNTDKNILDIADQYGKYVTFQDDNVLSKGLSAVKRGLNLGKEFGVGSLVVKYPRTPGALTMRGLDYSAAGFLKSAYEVAKPLLKGGKINTREATMALSRAITGTLGFTGLGYYLADNGVITGRTNKDADVRNLQTQTGAGSYKVNLSALKRWAMSGFNTSTLKLQDGDMLYSYDWAQPIAMAVSFGANINQNIKDNKGVLNNFSATAASSMEGALGTITEQPVLQGVTRLFQGYDLGQNITNTLKGIPSSFTPTILNQIRQLGDNTGRSTYNPSPLKESLNMAKVKIPGLSGQLPANYDTLGKQKENFQNGSNNFFNVFLNPGFVSKNNPTPIQKEILRLYDTTGDKTQFPKVISDKISYSVNGKPNSYTLSQEEKPLYQKAVGELAQQRISTFMNQKSYINYTDAQKVKTVYNILSDTSEWVKNNFLKQKGLR
jgi:hypothetical protein